MVESRSLHKCSYSGRIVAGGYSPVRLRWLSGLRSLGRVNKNAWQNLGLTTLAVVTLAGVVYMFGTWPPDPPRVAAAQTATTAAPAPEPTEPTTVAILGDSYTAGTPLGGIGEAGWPDILAERRDWLTEISAIGGTGFLSGQPGETFGAPSRIGQVVAAEPDLILVVGGGNDEELSHTEIKDEAVRVLSTLQRRAPDARVVLVAPLYLAVDQPDTIPSLRRTFDRVAERTDVAHIDPTGWLDDPKWIGSDNVHPTDAGHQRLAKLMDSALRRVL